MGLHKNLIGKPQRMVTNAESLILSHTKNSLSPP